ncbi:Arc family DNA-binding protein [Acinetobacter radioresistens]|uniref:Arc family DNA-binding protein n=1 Tax=Acinetobacter radioresistens TaxID=40216 RepID=UPI0035CCD154
MSREDPQLKIRLPLELKEKITESASKYGRSINSEVVTRLEESFDENKVFISKDKLTSFLLDVEKITNNSKEQAKLIKDQSMVIDNLGEVIDLVDQTEFHKTKLAKLFVEFANQEEYQIKNQEK